MIYAIAAPLMRSLHAHIYGLENVRRGARMSPTGTVIFCLWHQSLMSALATPHKHIRLAALASRSGDGQIIADYMNRTGVRPIRGSSGRGGAHAAKELIAALRSGFHVAIAVDGPRGPFKHVKSGPLEVARRYGIPLVPIGVRATREVHLRGSWDRFRIPLPRAHLAIMYGDPIQYGEQEPEDKELVSRQTEVGRCLHELEERAGRLVGK